MKCLTHIILTSRNPKKRDKAVVIKKRIKNFEFLCMLIVQCKILQIVNILSKAMQCKTIDLNFAIKLLQTAAEDIAQLKRSFDAILNKADIIAFTWGLPRQFLNKKTKKTNGYFDEISKRIMLSNLKKRFCVTVFLPVMDILSCQLINRFEEMKPVVALYDIKFWKQVFNQMLLIWILRLKQENFVTNFLITCLCCFLAKCFPSNRPLDKNCPFKICQRHGLFFDC